MAGDGTGEGGLIGSLIVQPRSPGRALHEAAVGDHAAKA